MKNAKDKRQKSKGEGAFTFLEMMVVVLLIGLTMVLVASQADFLIPRYTLRSAVRTVASMARLARSQAISSGRPCYLEYDLGEQQCRILGPSSGDEDQEAESDEPAGPSGILVEAASSLKTLFEETMPEGTRMVQVDFADGTKQDSGKLRLTFTPFGTTQTHMVHLLSEKEEDTQYSIEVNALTGTARIYDEYRELREVTEDTGQ